MDQLSKTEALRPRTSASCRRAERNVWGTVHRQGKECDRWIDGSLLFVSLPPGRTKKLMTGQSSLTLEKGEVAGVVRALLESGRSDGGLRFTGSPYFSFTPPSGRRTADGRRSPMALRPADRREQRTQKTYSAQAEEKRGMVRSEGRGGEASGKSAGRDGDGAQFPIGHGRGVVLVFRYGMGGEAWAR